MQSGVSIYYYAHARVTEIRVYDEAFIYATYEVQILVRIFVDFDTMTAICVASAKRR